MPKVYYLETKSTVKEITNFSIRFVINITLLSFSLNLIVYVNAFTS